MHFMPVLALAVAASALALAQASNEQSVKGLMEQASPSAPAAASAKPGDVPVAWYTGDGTTSSLTGGPTATLENGAGYDHGVVGRGFSFNGASQQVSAPNNPHWNFGTSDFSITAWVNVSVSTPPQGHPIVAHDEGQGNTNKWIFILGGNGLTFFMGTTSGGGEVVTDTGYFAPLNEWHHYAVTRSISTFTLYVDGLPVASATNSSPVPTANARLTIGGYEGFFLTGFIDEVKIYDRALSAAEVRDFGFVPGAYLVH